MFELGGLEEVAIALGVLVVAVVLFLLWRMGFLNRKTLPVVGGALAALGALAFVRSRKRDRLKQEIEAKEKQLEEEEKRLEVAKDNAEISLQELERKKAAIEREREEHRREMLRVDAETEEEKRRIDSLSTDELLDEFSSTFGTQGRGGGS